MTRLLDDLTVLLVALTVDDLDRTERRAIDTVAARIEAEVNRQTPSNPLLVGWEELPEWRAWDRIDFAGLFAVLADDEPISGIRTAAGRLIVPADDAGAAEAILGPPDARILRGVPCGWSDDHDRWCLCRGYGVAFPLRPGAVPQFPDARWLRLTRMETPQ